jgi:hypothetical protein
MSPQRRDSRRKRKYFGNSKVTCPRLLPPQYDTFGHTYGTQTRVQPASLWSRARYAMRTVCRYAEERTYRVR